VYIPLKLATYFCKRAASAQSNASINHHTTLVRATHACAAGVRGQIEALALGRWQCNGSGFKVVMLGV
jgi:hypothetical protein